MLTEQELQHSETFIGDFINFLANTLFHGLFLHVDMSALDRTISTPPVAYCYLCHSICLRLVGWELTWASWARGKTERPRVTEMAATFDRKE